MERDASRLAPVVGGIILLTLLIGMGLPFLFAKIRSRDAHAIWHEGVRKISHGFDPEKGHWVGDVSELYTMGVIVRELAEADAAPIHPLVEKSIPFHGCLVRSLDGGQPMTMGDDDHAPSFKGQTWSKETFGYCIYPADGDPKTPTWLIGPLGLYRRYGGDPAPLKWPTRKEMQQGWSIVD